jgi:hypothetical protein
LLALAAIDLLRIRADLSRGQASLRALDFNTVDEGGGIVRVATDASSQLDRAADRASRSPWLDALSYLPALGNQVHGVRDLTNVAAQAGDQGLAAATKVQAALDRTGTGGPGERVGLAATVATTLEELRGAIDAIHVPDRDGLVGPLASARQQLVDRLAKASRELGDGARRAHVLETFLAGPRRFLILGGNNAEMRAFGITTTAGVAAIKDGSMEVSDFLGADKTILPPPGVPVSDDWFTLYQFLDPGRQYSTDVMSPNFPEVARVAASISDQNAIGPVDGVIFADTVALQSLLQIIGPVTVDGVTYDGDNAARILINENYIKYGTAEDAPARRDQQSVVAKTLFKAMNERHVPILKLASRLQLLAQSRHLLIASKDAGENELFHAAGATGELTPDSLLVASENIGASKLDFYVPVTVDGSVELFTDHRRINLDISITNPAGVATSPYIDFSSPYANPTEYGSFLLVYMPQSAFDVQNPVPGLTRLARDGPVSVAGMVLRIPRGQTQVTRLSFSLPLSVDAMDLVPSTRLSPIIYRLNGHVFSDQLPNRILLAPLTPPKQPTGWLFVGMVLLGLGIVATGGAAATRAEARATNELIAAKRATIDVRTGELLLALSAAMLLAYAYFQQFA